MVPHGVMVEFRAGRIGDVVRAGADKKDRRVARISVCMLVIPLLREADRAAVVVEPRRARLPERRALQLRLLRRLWPNARFGCAMNAREIIHRASVVLTRKA